MSSELKDMIVFMKALNVSKEDGLSILLLFNGFDR